MTVLDGMYDAGELAAIMRELSSGTYHDTELSLKIRRGEAMVAFLKTVHEMYAADMSRLPNSGELLARTRILMNHIEEQGPITENVLNDLLELTGDICKALAATRREDHNPGFH